MKFFQKKTIAKAVGGAFLSLSILGSTALFTEQRAQAQIPVTDVASLMQTIQDGIMRAMESEIMQTIEQTALDMMGIFSEMEVDTINNGFGNMIARVGRAMQDIQNIEQKEKSQPAQDVCDTITLSKSLDDMLCDMEAQTAALNKASAAARAISSGRGSVDCKDGVCTPVDAPPSLDQVQRYNNHVAEEQRKTCESLLDADNQSLCLKASLVVNPPPQGLDANEMKAALEMNKAAAGITEKLPRANDSNKQLEGQPIHDKMLALDSRSTYFKHSFKSALDYNTLLTQGTLEADGSRKMGDVLTLERYLSTRLGSQNWLCEISNTCDQVEVNEFGEKPYVAPAELEKRTAQMDAVLLYLSLQQYKSMLRIERSLADIGLMTLEHPDADK